MKAMKPIDEKAVTLVRNALLVAGHEMGEDGDHWPAVNQAIYDIAKDWDQLKNERAAHAEMKKHIYTQLDEMEKLLETCSAEDRADAEPKIKELREIYDAYFAPVTSVMPLSEEEKPLYIKRAEEIILSLEDSHD